MEDKPKAVKVKLSNGKKQTIQISDISSYREWEEKESKSTEMIAIVVKSGKQFVCNISEEKLDKLFNIFDLTI